MIHHIGGVHTLQLVKLCWKAEVLGPARPRSQYHQMQAAALVPLAKDDVACCEASDS